jgi:hypothetical protein
MTIKIEKNVPFPSRRNKYPISDMEVGDSFFVPGKKSTQAGAIVFKHVQKGKKFSSRTCTQEVNGETVNGVRIWRIK